MLELPWEQMSPGSETPLSSWKSFFLSVESDPTTLDCIAGEEIAEKHEAEVECLLVVGGRKCTA
jgi:hypothetical protein